MNSYDQQSQDQNRIMIQVDNQVSSGRNYLEEGYPDLAIDAFTVAIDLYPNSAIVYDFRSIAYMQVYEFDRAIADSNMAILIDNHYPGGYANRGLAYYKISRFDEALRDCNIAIELAPNVPIVYFNRALVRHNLECYNDAIRDFNKALELGLDDSETYQFRAETFMELGEYERAAADFKKASILDPSNVSAQVYLMLIKHHQMNG